MSSNAWMYWEQPVGGSRAPYLDLCLDTVTRHAEGVNLTVVDESTIFDYAPVKRDTWSRLTTIVQRADYARSHLIYEHGGLWLDFDCVVMRPLGDLLEGLSVANVAGWGREDSGNFFIGMFAAHPGSPFIAAWVEEQERRIRAAHDPQRLGWTALGADITSTLAQKFKYFCWPMGYVAPVQWWEWRRFTSRVESPQRVLAHSPATVMLYNKVMSRHFSPLSSAELLHQRTLLSRLFRIALGITSVAGELDFSVRFDSLSRMRFTKPARQVEHLVRSALGEPDPWAGI